MKWDEKSHGSDQMRSQIQGNPLHVFSQPPSVPFPNLVCLFLCLFWQRQRQGQIQPQRKGNSLHVFYQPPSVPFPDLVCLFLCLFCLSRKEKKLVHKVMLLKVWTLIVLKKRAGTYLMHGKGHKVRQLYSHVFVSLVTCLLILSKLI